jgi:hypothetical protein
MGFFYAMKKNIIEFENIANQYELTTRVIFNYNEDGHNPIEVQLLSFYGNLYYCQFTSLLLEKIIIEDDRSIYEIIPNRKINDMRQLMFMQISNRDAIYGIEYKDFHQRLLMDIWKETYELYETTDEQNPWDFENLVHEEKPNLLQKNRNTEVHYLYVIKDLATGYFKIGHTKNIKRRYKTLLSDRFSLVVEQAYELDNSNYAINLEKKLHLYFAEKKNIGEWFDLKHLNYDQLSEIIYAEADKLNYDLFESNIEWSYDSRYQIQNGIK